MGTKVAEFLEIPYTEYIRKTTKIVERVEKIKHIVESKNERKIRIREELASHSLISNVPWKKLQNSKLKCRIYLAYR